MSVEQLRRLVESATRWEFNDERPEPPAGDNADEPPFRIVDMARLGRDDNAPQSWFWDGYIPAGHVTLLGGHGGAGKSTLALHVAACMAAGVDAFGRATTRARVAFFGAEDPAELELHRLRRLCHRLGLPLADVQAWLQIIDTSDLDPVLFAERRVDGTRCGLETSTYRALAEYIEREAFDVVVIDNASDVFDGDEINRSMVRAFIRSLVRIVRPRGGAILLLAHVDKLTSRAGKMAGSESYSGSTAWHNSVRSRLFLLEHEAGMLELQHQKCNLGPKLPPLRLEWPTDDVMQVSMAGGFVAGMEAKADAKALVRLIHEYVQRGEFVAASTSSRHNAAKLFAQEATYPKGLTASDTFALLRDAERDGWLIREQYRDAGRKWHERWALTPAGREAIGVAPTAPTAPTSMDGTHDA